MANFRTDQFDNLPDDVARVGAHRGPKVKGRGWITFAWALLAVVVLVVGGLYVLSIFDGQVKFGLGGTTASSATPTPSGTPTPVITPIQDPSTIAARAITVTVLNGTAVVGEQTKAGAALTAKGWNVIATANSTATNITTTTVYYSNAADKDVAEGIQQVLNAPDIQFSAAFPGSSVTVVIGSDYKG
jgi:hypothetical protein